MTRPLQRQIDELKISETAQTQYGLSSVLPTDYIEWIGKYNEHWWACDPTSVITKTRYVEKQVTISEQKKLLTVVSKDASSNATISISESIQINSDTGDITLINPSTYTINGGDITNETTMGAWSIKIAQMAPCYIMSQTGEIYFIPNGANAESGAGSLSYTICAMYYYNKESYWCLSEYANPVANVVTATPETYTIYQTFYEHSTDRNAYPDSGTVDGITYTYLGVPFEHFKVKTHHSEYGSYTGSGNYGSSYKNKLTFDGKPLLVVIREKTRSISNNSDYTLILLRECAWALGAEENYYYEQTVSWEANSVSWYSSNAATGQFNTSGKTFCYAALLES